MYSTSVCMTSVYYLYLLFIFKHVTFLHLLSHNNINFIKIQDGFIVARRSKRCIGKTHHKQQGFNDFLFYQNQKYILRFTKLLCHLYINQSQRKWYTVRSFNNFECTSRRIAQSQINPVPHMNRGHMITARW